MRAKEKVKSNELKILREYDAPVRAVWDAWTDPAKAAKWWGPRGFTITTHSKDLRPGGVWHYTMHGPDGVDYPNKTKYIEIEQYAKLVYDHGGYDDRPPLFRVTVLFSESKGKTQMNMSMTLPTPEAAEETHRFIKKADGYSTWDRLAEYMEVQRSGAERFVINRSFDAPIDVMFDMWTDPKHVARWLPPTGSEMQYVKADIRVGGSSIFVMSGPARPKLYGRIEYLTIEKPRLVVYTQQFCDEHGKVGRHPAVPTWPETMLTTVQLTDEGDDRTRVTVTWEPRGATPKEIETFTKERGGMTQGWNGSFDKLEACLK